MTAFWVLFAAMQLVWSGVAWSYPYGDRRELWATGAVLVTLFLFFLKGATNV